MARPDKVATVADLTDKFTSSAAAVLTEYRGLTVKALKNLRRSLGSDATYAVAKNTLTTIAAKNAGFDGLESYLAGPTAIAFITGDVASVAKGLRAFARDHPALVLKGGVMDGKVLDADTVKKLADLESREVLLSKMAGALKASLSQAVYLFAAPLSQAARAFGALEQEASTNPSLIAGGASAPKADATSAAEAEPASPAEDSVTDAASAALTFAALAAQEQE